MSLKNYYRILGVPITASRDELRTAFRSLAKKYHPDAAPDNPFASAHFAEIQEAYEVLSNPARRGAYDEERWLRGLTSRSNATLHITPEWILQEATRLRRHMETVDTYRMNHAALRDYVAALLSPEHLSVLREAPELRGRILDEVLLSLQTLRHNYTAELVPKLLQLSGDNEQLSRAISEWAAQQRMAAKWALYRPLLGLLLALMICVLIWWLR